ncbi:uncharacterized protein [Aristolochia californica]|uniref:uncharacterized protein isoform X2 n=1 Tax=Aristolochia californica TaxID=171875 RepID=UPI0035D97200
MPRKVNYGVDYDDNYYDDYDDYNDYGDYDYADYGYEGEGHKEPSHSVEAISKPGVWRCSICTYDNEESLPSCDICGAIRDTSITIHDSAEDNKGPFKFDIPSPDDLVSTAKSAPGKNSKAGSVQLTLSKVAASTGPRKGKVASSNKTLENSSVSLQKVAQPGKDVANSSFSKKDKIQPPSNGSANLSLSYNINPSTVKNIKKPTLQADYKTEKWMLPDQEHDALTQLSLAIVGHVDSGKSTLSGRLLHVSGRVSQKQMHKYEKESKQKGKGSFMYAWALDESPEERERGITMTVAVAYFNTRKYHVVLLDSPGHKDFVPNMISGATQADAAILVVDASIGSFEAGMDGNGRGQTKEHAQLIRSFGVEQLIVAVNKMDAVEYSQERFDLIKLQLGTFLRTCGFKESSIAWVPLSAMQNQNLVAPPADTRLLSWFRGYPLLDAIDSLEAPVRDIYKPLRMPICDVLKLQSTGQLTATGKLETGAIKAGLKVLVMPLGDIATVRSIEWDSQICSAARAGDNVSVVLQGIDESRVTTGGVLCHPNFPVAEATHLELKVIILDVAMPILIGSQVEFHIHHAKEAGRVVKILSVLDPKTGKPSKRAPRCLLAKQSAVIEVTLDRPVCVEPFSDCRGLGRAFLRASGTTLAVGIVNKIVQQHDS